MAERRLRHNAQDGAALLIVLLLVATLSFIVLSLSQQTRLIASRSGAAGMRHEAGWGALGAEAMAKSAIEASYKAGEGGLSPDAALFAAPRQLPFDHGRAELRFIDRTACFNVNSLVARDDSGRLKQNASAKSEFMELANQAGIGTGTAESLAAVIIDWIDDDRSVEPGGAEDGFYSALPVPYRTGGALLADVSELRAMSGATSELYQALRPWLCANPETAPSRINVNLLRNESAPILSALTNGKLPIGDAVRIIDARPPGGFVTAEEFWAAVELNSDDEFGNIRERIALKSRYVEAQLVLEFGDFRRKAAFSFMIDDGGRARLLSRRFGEFS